MKSNNPNPDAIKINCISKGMLHKKLSDNQKYYYKTGFKDQYGDFENNTVKAECLASDLGTALGINVLKQKLKYSKDGVAYCKSRNFLLDGESIIYFSQMGLFDYAMIKRKLPDFVEYFNTILIFDFIINNRDRHLNNLCLILDSFGNYREPPIFDNGCSFYYDLNSRQLDYILNSDYGYKKYCLSKPYKLRHYNQIKILDGPLPELNFNIDVVNLVNKYFTGLRGEAIINLINSRLEYLKDMYKDYEQHNYQTPKPEYYKPRQIIYNLTPKPDEYYLMYKDKRIGIIGYSNGNYYLHIINGELQWFEYPPIWGDYPVKDVFEPYNKSKLKSFINNKVIPEERSSELLELLGMDSYNVWEILKYTRGVTVDDYWWLAKPGDDYYKIHIREVL